MEKEGHKRCPSPLGCGYLKPVSQFRKRGEGRGGWYSYCLDCSRVMDRDRARRQRATGQRVRAPDEREAARASRDGRRERNQRLLWELKAATGCVDCGNLDPRVLHFDHVKGDKVHNLAQLAALGYSTQVLLAEVAKCEVVCANCHMIRTGERSGWATYG